MEAAEKVASVKCTIFLLSIATLEINLLFNSLYCHFL